MCCKMQCPYLTTKNNCIAKPYGTEAYLPDQKSLENYCNNENNINDCTRAIIYRAYLKSGGK
jgi:hypothetical protein